MVHPLIKTYRQLEGRLKYAIKSSHIKVSCKQGCAHCCYLMAVIHHLEGYILAKAALRLHDWKEIAQNAREAALIIKELDSNRQAYFQTRTPCPLLDLEKKECRAYEVRPAVCRFYLSISDPSICSPENQTELVSLVNTSVIDAVSLKECVESSKGECIIAPLPLMLLFSMWRIEPTSEGKNFLRGLIQDLPNPTEWLNNNIGKSEQWSMELHESARSAYREAYSAVFGEGAPT